VHFRAPKAVAKALASLCTKYTLTRRSQRIIVYKVHIDIGILGYWILDIGILGYLGIGYWVDLAEIEPVSGIESHRLVAFLSGAVSTRR
jgi:hypothetical protein